MESKESNTHPLDKAPNEESLSESASTSQREKRVKRKRKLTEQSSEEKVTKKKGEIEINEEDDELRCSICTELFITAVTLTCSHTFCKYCIDFWRRNRTDCPICRTEIADGVSPTVIIDNLILKIIGKCSNEVKERRIQIIEERTAETAAHASRVEENPINVYSYEESPGFIQNLQRVIHHIIRERSRRVSRHRTRQ